VHLVSRSALARAETGEVPDGCSAEDPRANLVLELSGEDDERAWVGRLLRVGDAVLEVTRTPKHCLGVYAEVRRAGHVSVGDAVLL
jgi:MOSC domain-containing protein YiiM